MAASTATVGVAAGVGPLRNAAGLSSSSSFGAPLVSFAPIRPVTKSGVIITRAALPADQSEKTARREFVASLIAAGAAFATVGQSVAASGPGTSGGQRTNEKANDLLKAADKLTTEDSPPRFGPGRIGGDDTSRIAQKGGAGAFEDLQGGTTDAVEGAKANVAKTRKIIDKIFGKARGDLSDNSILDDAGSKVSSDIDTTKDKVSSDVSTTSGISDELKDKAGSVVADAKTSFSDLVDKISGQ